MFNLMKGPSCWSFTPQKERPQVVKGHVVVLISKQTRLTENNLMAKKGLVSANDIMESNMKKEESINFPQTFSSITLNPLREIVMKNLEHGHLPDNASMPFIRWCTNILRRWIINWMQFAQCSTTSQHKLGLIHAHISHNMASRQNNPLLCKPWHDTSVRRYEISSTLVLFSQSSRFKTRWLMTIMLWLQPTTRYHW